MSLAKFSPIGTAISRNWRSPAADFHGSPFTIAIAGSGNVWATNEGSSSLSKFSNDGTPLSPSTGYTVAG